MNKKNQKLKLENLKVNSFVTSIEGENKKTINGQYDDANMGSRIKLKCMINKIIDAAGSKAKPCTRRTIDPNNKECVDLFEQIKKRSIKFLFGCKDDTHVLKDCFKKI